MAVDPSSYPEAGTATLYSERTLEVEADGTFTVRQRMVRQVLQKGAVQGVSEPSFGYDPMREAFTLDWVRVVDRDGRVVGEPVHVQELDEPVSRTAPVYSTRKRVRASLAQVDTGRIVDLHYTLRVTDPPLSGDVFTRWSVESSVPVRRTRLVLDAPSTSELRVVEENLDGPSRDEKRDGRWIREWFFENVEPPEREMFAAPPEDFPRRVTIGASMSWDAVAGWYAELAEGRDQVTPAMEARLAEILEGATTLTDSLAAVHRWVAQEVRYASISLGMAGYRPRAAPEVFDAAVGDCKDKTTLFLALVRHLGVEGHPVLVSTNGTVDPDVPSIRPFNHMIAAIHPGGDWVYLDLTVPVAPFGELYGGLQGRTGVMLDDDGTAEIVDFPSSPASANRSAIRIDGEIDANGHFDGVYAERVTGSLQYRLRSEFARAPSPRMRESFARGIGGRVFEDAVADSLVLLDGLDLDTEPELWAHVEADSVLDAVPGGWMLPLRLQTYADPSTVARVAADSVRDYPIDTGAVFGLKTHLTELHYRLPDGWTADLPESVRLVGAFGRYESTYVQDGQELTIRRLIEGTDDILPAERVDELVGWLRSLADDEVRYIVLRTGGD